MSGTSKDRRLSTCPLNHRLTAGVIRLLSAIAIAVTTVGPVLAQDGDASYYAPRNWDVASDGTVHFSVFVYRDMNGSGNFDLGDRAFAGIAVEAVTPQGETVVDRSNMDGYANFKASLTGEDRQFGTPGTYRLRLVPPPGWSVTSANTEQTIEVADLPGSPGGLVMTRMAAPVGLAPDLEIRGRAREGVAPAGITATGPLGAVVSAEADEEGRFVLPVDAGDWTVAIGGDAAREVEVGPASVVLPLAPDRSAATEGDIVTADFEELQRFEGASKIFDGYKGLNWDNWVATQNHFYGGEGYINGTIDGDNVGYLGSGHPAQISRDAPFDFLGGYFSVAWPDAEGETLNIRAWAGERLMHEDSVRLSAYGPVYFAAGYRGVTRIEFATAHYWQAVADDLKFVIPPQ